LSPPGGLCFSHDGALLAASPSHENSLKLWRTIDGIEFHDLKLTGDHHGHGHGAMAFSPDDKLFAAAGEKGGVILWEVATGDRLRTLAGHIRPVTSLAFSPDGKWLLSGSEDTTALLWDVAGDGRKRVTLTETELAAYWQGLAATDPDVVEAANRRLLQAPEQTVTMLDQRLAAGQPLNMEELPDWIAQLVGEDPTVSLQAEAKLRDFGKKASPTLFEALADARSPVARRRIEDTLAAIGRHPIPPDQLRRSRGINLLELIGTDEAQKSLERLAQNTPPTPTSRDAAQALARLKSRIKRAAPLQH
jgi:hypothetical protein